MPIETRPQRARSLTADLVDRLGDRIRGGSWSTGDKLPREADLMSEFGVSRTVVREAISRLQAAGMVETRHGVGSFAIGLGEGSSFRIGSNHSGTLRDVIAVLELRMAVETEAAGLAAARCTAAHLVAMRAAIRAFAMALEAGADAVGPDYQFHLEIARATGNRHFSELMGTLGGSMIPRARLTRPNSPGAADLDYLRRVNVEHETILDAIARGDADGARAAMRIHLSNSRERRRREADQGGGFA